MWFAIDDFLAGKEFDVINISGGEPLSHPNFYRILEICKAHVKPRNGRVWVYTNAIPGIMFNANVIPEVPVHANLFTADNTEQVHILKPVNQGRQADRPKVSFSCNYDGQCNADCGHTVTMPDGTIHPAPCKKE
jgi:organic radical activating enzyme